MSAYQLNLRALGAVCLASALPAAACGETNPPSALTTVTAPGTDSIVASRSTQSIVASPMTIRFARPPLASVQLQTSGSGERYFTVYVTVRTTRALKTFSNGNARVAVSVNGEQSLDPTSRIGRRGRNCYATGGLESDKHRAGDRVVVALKAPGFTGIRQTVSVKDENTRPGRILGCGGRKT